MNKVLSSRFKYVLGILIILLLILIAFREEPLSEKLHTDNIESNVYAELWSRYREPKNNGDIYSSWHIYTIENSIDSEAVQELIKTLESIPAKKRFFFPFERMPVFNSNYDSLHIEFTTNGKTIHVTMLEDFSTLYDSGSSPYKAYSVDLEAFEKIASVIEKYGEIEGITPKDTNDETK